jgi:hypothetical protein
MSVCCSPKVCVIHFCHSDCVLGQERLRFLLKKCRAWRLAGARRSFLSLRLRAWQARLRFLLECPDLLQAGPLLVLRCDSLVEDWKGCPWRRGPRECRATCVKV